MGTWSTESFGNDDALDWLAALKDARDATSFIAETLRSGSTESVVAAGEVLALLAGHPGEVPPDVAAWCAGKAAPPPALRQAAADAIQAILDDPEADGHDTWAELGEDHEDYRAWLHTLRGIQVRLRA